MGHCFFFFVCTWKVEQREKKISIFFLLRGGRNPSLLLLCIHAAEEEALTMSSPDIPFFYMRGMLGRTNPFFLHACPTWEVSPVLFSFLLFSALTLLPCKSPAKNMSFFSTLTRASRIKKGNEGRDLFFFFLKKVRENEHLDFFLSAIFIFCSAVDPIKARANIGSIKISFFAIFSEAFFFTGKYVCSCRNSVPTSDEGGVKSSECPKFTRLAIATDSLETFPKNPFPGTEHFLPKKGENTLADFEENRVTFDARHLRKKNDFLLNFKFSFSSKAKCQLRRRTFR